MKPDRKIPVLLCVKGVCMQQLAFLHVVSLMGVGDETQQNVQLLVLLLVITLAVALVSRPLRLPYTLVKAWCMGWCW